MYHLGIVIVNINTSEPCTKLHNGRQIIVGLPRCPLKCLFIQGYLNHLEPSIINWSLVIILASPPLRAFSNCHGLLEFQCQISKLIPAPQTHEFEWLFIYQEIVTRPLPGLHYFQQRNVRECQGSTMSLLAVYGKKGCPSSTLYVVVWQCPGINV